MTDQQQADQRQADPPAVRLLGTLTIAGALAGLLLVLVNGWAEPRIEAHRAEVLRDAIQEVLGGPDHTRTMFLVNGRFTADPPADVDTSRLERIYAGYDENDRSVGLAISGGEPGFQDVIQLLFGFDPATGRVTGMKVLESKETPGLGDKIEKDPAFLAEFSGPVPPLVGVKQGTGAGAEHEVDMITGATISSRTVIDIINHRLEELRPYLEGLEGGTP